MKKLSIQEMQSCVGGVGITKQFAVAAKIISFKIMQPGLNTLKATAVAVRF